MIILNTHSRVKIQIWFWRSVLLWVVLVWEHFLQQEEDQQADQHPEALGHVVVLFHSWNENREPRSASTVRRSPNTTRLQAALFTPTGAVDRKHVQCNEYARFMCEKWVRGVVKEDMWYVWRGGITWGAGLGPRLRKQVEEDVAEETTNGKAQELLQLLAPVWDIENRKK